MRSPRWWVLGLALAVALPALVGHRGSARAAQLAGRVATQDSGRNACSSMIAPGRPLKRVRTTFVQLPAPPFGVSTTSNGEWVFVDEIDRIAVFSEARFVPRQVRTVRMPGGAAGNSLTPDGRYLLVADGGGGATVVDVARAESGRGNAVLGTLEHPGRGRGATEVTTSRDGTYAFVSVESGDRIAVYDLHAALKSGFRSSFYVGSVPLGDGPVGMAASPDDRWLYATSELARRGIPAGEGTLSVINVAKAERLPAHAVVSIVRARCSPVRVVVSSDGQTVWVTARGSNQLLAFSAQNLRARPARALLAAVRVGAAPVGLAFVDRGRAMIVADSGRSRAKGAHPALTVVSVAAALAHRQAVIGSIRAGSFPREMALVPKHRVLLVGNFASQQLEAVAINSRSPFPATRRHASQR